jgi:peptidyl-prolyl cis-trans isomerase D
LDAAPKATLAFFQSTDFRMLSAFRRLSKSAVGTIIMVLFLLAILASFAIADISSVRSGSLGIGPGNLVKVGDEKVTERELSDAMRRALNRLREQDPEATYANLVNQFDPILESMVDERALVAFAEDHGFSLSNG